MKFRIIEIYTTESTPHLDEVQDTEGVCHWDPEYIHCILKDHPECLWECEGWKTGMDVEKPMWQLFLRSDSVWFDKLAKEALESNGATFVISENKLT